MSSSRHILFALILLMPTRPSRPDLWQRKLRYLLNHHGCLAAVARAAALRPTRVQRVATETPAKEAVTKLDREAVRRIERDLDLPDGWFDASAFLPSTL